MIKMGKKSIRIGRRLIGEGKPCFVVAEIGVNHNGDLKLAKRMIMAAKRCGADAVKFQNYETEDFLSDRRLKYTYLSNGKRIVVSQFDMFKQCELSFRQIRELKDYCDKLKIIFFSTPSSVKGVCELNKMRVGLLKNSSDNINNFDLISAMAKTSIPLVISTGMSTISEIEDAVRTFKKSGGRELVLLYCVSLYPARMEHINLRRIPLLVSKFACPVGLSDHSEGNLAAISAVALGASFIEKHFTLAKDLPGPDHQFSADPKEFAALVSDIRRVELGLRAAPDELSDAEEKARERFRLSCSAKCNIEKGKVLKKNMIAFRRPGTGIPAGNLKFIIGKKSQRYLYKNSIINFDDIC